MAESSEAQNSGPGYKDVYDITERDFKDETIDNRLTLAEWQENVRDLHADARAINEALEDEKSMTMTTIVCAALQHKVTDKVYLFAFTNKNALYFNPKNNDEYKKMVEEGHTRGYHFVQAQQSHAEGALLQFLSEKRGVFEKYPLKAGCSRPVCQNCAYLLDSLWGREVRERVFGPEVDAPTRHWYTPAALMGLIVHSPRTEDFRYLRVLVEPEYADYWRPADSYNGCVSYAEEAGLSTELYPSWVCQSTCNVKHSWHKHNPLY